jgi:hypothetical protein
MTLLFAHSTIKPLEAVLHEVDLWEVVLNGTAMVVGGTAVQAMRLFNPLRLSVRPIEGFCVGLSSNNSSGLANIPTATSAKSPRQRE